MRIAYLIINYNKREGTSKAIAEVAERLGCKHDVHIFASSIRDLGNDRLNVRKLYGLRRPHVLEFLSYTLQIGFHLKRSDFDIIHAAGAIYSEANVYTIQNIQPAKRKILAGLASEERVGVARRLTRSSYLQVTSNYERDCYRPRGARSPLILPVSSGVLREIEEYYPVSDCPREIVPNAADIQRFRPVNRDVRLAWREKEKFSGDDLLLAFTGGEWRRKGLDLAIAGLAALNQKSVRLLVFGRDDTQADFEAQAKSMGVWDRVHFLGYRKDVHVAMASCDAFLFPSRYEAFSLATIEAAACGLPLFTSRINGTEDFVRPGVDGEFVEHSAGSIAEMLNRHLFSPAALAKMGKSARENVENNYSWDRVAIQTEEAYLNYLGR